MASLPQRKTKLGCSCIQRKQILLVIIVVSSDSSGRDVARSVLHRTMHRLTDCANKNTFAKHRFQAFPFTLSSIPIGLQCKLDSHSICRESFTTNEPRMPRSCVQQTVCISIFRRCCCDFFFFSRQATRARRQTSKSQNAEKSNESICQMHVKARSIMEKCYFKATLPNRNACHGIQN